MSTGAQRPQADVTVVIPVYQREALVGRAVHSALLQSPRPAAVLVIDDGSTDDSARVAKEAGAHVISQVNQGEGAARNAGLRAAQTTWVALLDSDDQWLPGHLDTLVRHAADNVVMVGTAARAVPSGRFNGYPGRQPRRLGPADLLWPDNPFVTSATMLRRQTAMDVGGFPDDRLAEDLDLWIRMLEQGAGVIEPAPTCLYHEHSGQLSSVMTDMQNARQVVARRYRDRGWFDPALPRHLRTLDNWDRMRHAARDHDWSAAARQAASLVAHPDPTALIDTWRWRALGRRHR